MSCSPFDLKDYFLKELTDPQQLQMEAHIHDCQACREELDRLRLTQTALFSLRDEEMPQRIAFVSDPVFEPSPWRRWWSGFWGSSARLGFASAAMLSGALVFFAVTRPAAVVQKMVETPVQTAAAVAPSEAEIQQRVNRAVNAAVAVAVDRAVAVRTRDIVAQLEQARSSLVLADANFEIWRKRDLVKYRQATNFAPAERGENQ